MKLLIVTLLLLSFNFTSAHPHCRTNDPTKPRHCHLPAKDNSLDMKVDKFGHGLLGGISSVAVGKALRDNGLKEQDAAILAIASSLLLPLVLEEDKREREEAMQSAVLGAVALQYLTFEF